VHISFSIILIVPLHAMAVCLSVSCAKWLALGVEDGVAIKETWFCRSIFVYFCMVVLWGK